MLLQLRPNYSSKKKKKKKKVNNKPNKMQIFIYKKIEIVIQINYNYIAKVRAT